MLGLTGGDFRGVAHKDTVTIYFVLAVTSLAIGGVVAGALADRSVAARWPPPSAVFVLRSRPLLGVAAAIIAAALVNMATGTIPLLAGDVDEARFNTEGGISPRCSCS